MKTKCQVFLSYARHDIKKASKIRQALGEVGIRAYQDVRNIPASALWRKEIVAAIKESKVVTLLLSKSAALSDQVPKEMDLASDLGRPLVPLELERVELPDSMLYELAGINRIRWWDTDDWAIKFDRLLEALEAHGVRPTRTPVRPRIADNSLPGGAAHLVGREEELAKLSRAWRSRSTHVLTIVGWGGLGKTSLVVEWIARRAKAGWPGFEAVFPWSFYDQGTREKGTTSADPFLNACLQFFGGEEGRKLAESQVSGEEKGAKLVEYIRRQRTLLVLDGLEPLQYPPGPQAGQVRDPALAALLRGLALDNPGLCLVTSREPVADLSSYQDTTAPILELQHLSTPAGIRLLKCLGVRGNEQEYRSVVEEVRGHALTLDLLGRYLAAAHGGDIRKRDQVSFQEANAQQQGGHAFRVVATYETWLAGEGPTGLCCLAALRLLGLFDRPAEADCLDELRRAPAIRGLTEPLMDLSEAQWNVAVTRLAHCGLLTIRRPDPDHPSPADQPGAIDAHPLIREYFALQLRTKAPKAWQSAHERLYRFFSRQAPQQPERLEQLTPLFRAVAHGCQAGLHNEVLDEVYGPRIQRGRRGFAQKVLGAGLDDLVALSWFFERPWTGLVSTIDAEWRAWLPGNAASRLRALTRIPDAVEPLQFSLSEALRLRQAEMELARPSPRTARIIRLTALAAIRGRQASELALIRGDISAALAEAERAVAMADLIVDWSEKKTERAVLGDALHAAGFLAEAAAAFREAEKIQQTTRGRRAYVYLPDLLRHRWQRRSTRSGRTSVHQTFLEAGEQGASRSTSARYPHLYSLWGFRYNALLMQQGQYGEVLQRATEASQCANLDLSDGLGLLDLPLALLSLVQCRLAQFDAGMDVDLAAARETLDEAIRKLRHSGKHDFLPTAFLIEAGLFRRELIRHRRHPAAAARFAQLANAKLLETISLTSRCEMLSAQIDATVEAARLAQALNAPKKIRASLADARRLVAQTESPYQPLAPGFPARQRPKYLAPLTPGKTVGYHRHNAELDRIEAGLAPKT